MVMFQEDLKLKSGIYSDQVANSACEKIVTFQKDITQISRLAGPGG